MTKKIEELIGWEVFRIAKREDLYTMGRTYGDGRVALVVVSVNEKDEYSLTMQEPLFKMQSNDYVEVIEGAAVYF